MMHKNENRPGYKKTKVGWIPEGWECDLLEKHSKRGSGHTPNKKKPEYYEGSIVWISLADSSALDNGLISGSRITISEEGIKHSSAVLHPKDTVLLSRDAGVGKSAIAGCDLCVSQHFITWLCNETSLHNWFLYHHLQHRKREFERIAVGSTIKTIGLPYFKKYKLTLPPLPEQKAIAEVLECWDKGIRTLEKKIEKKRLIKKGLMQKLLSGQLRLPGFSKPWKTVKLGDVLSIGNGRDYKHLSYGSIPVFGTGGLMTYVNEKLHSGEAVFIGRKGTINKPFYYNGDFWTVDTLFFTHKFKSAFPRFIYELFQTINWEKYSEASGVPSLSKTVILKIEVTLPPLEEQRAIAEVLSAADKEIEALERKLALWKEQKKFLLNNLVTGTIRLPEFVKNA